MDKKEKEIQKQFEKDISYMTDKQLQDKIKYLKSRINDLYYYIYCMLQSEKQLNYYIDEKMYLENRLKIFEKVLNKRGAKNEKIKSNINK